MSGLTREKIKVWRMMANQPGTDYGKLLDVRHHIGELCDLALQSLSQEAVRDEALEEVARHLMHAAATWRALDAKQWPLAVIRAEECEERAKQARALKREPNAVGWNEKGIAGIGVLSGEVDATAEPAPAAPVAEMVRRLRELTDAADMLRNGDRSEYFIQGVITLLSATATLLAKLGQGWIPSETVIEIDEDGKVHPEGVNLKNLRPGASDD